ncbi:MULTISPECIES: hypothetical protein [Shouchella]|uniref:Uncharacterized protein n=2 Tax=Shouchella TaxID=2893057 RepID=A0ABY7WF74_9BACI|nr:MULTISPECIES: hypothetical protein [Shouchella]MED4129875.1 hypothetical protein [Shouchella miscanthi]WDF05325.1 hypothetical protein PQ477_07640 [Shouchella hunanensis]GAF23313.1 hypothetical protein JCM19047_3124 [Bacillus sp. JCM 19047]
MNFTLYPEVTLLTKSDSSEHERMHYLGDSWLVPKIGPRPPFYTHPRLDPEYPVL